ARSPHGLAIAPDDAAAEDGPDAANRRPDANTVAARTTAAATNMSALFMTSPSIIDAPIVLTARRGSHGRQMGDRWNPGKNTPSRSAEPFLLEELVRLSGAATSKLEALRQWRRCGLNPAAAAIGASN